jgi:beta-lactamase superfamily II metal-dependent hydrolase
MHHRRCIFVLVILSGILVITGLTSQAASNPNLQVSYINVGQGDSALIRDPSGLDVLIDGGKPAAGPTVVAYLHEQGVDDIDVMVATHADSDHIGGLIDVLAMADIPVVEVLYNGYPGDTNTWDDFAAAVAVEGITLTAAQFPQSFTWGETTAHILNPVPGLVNPETNDASVVILLDHGGIEFLFTGDIDESIEATVVARQTPVAAEILKVGYLSWEQLIRSSSRRDDKPVGGSWSAGSTDGYFWNSSHRERWRELLSARCSNSRRERLPAGSAETGSAGA